MTFIRRSVVFAVAICSCMVSAAQVHAHEWASAGALGDVFVATQDAAGKPLIKVFGHGCASPPPPEAATGSSRTTSGWRMVAMMLSR